MRFSSSQRVWGSLRGIKKRVSVAFQGVLRGFQEVPGVSRAFQRGIWAFEGVQGGTKEFQERIRDRKGVPGGLMVRRFHLVLEGCSGSLWHFVRF